MVRGPWRRRRPYCWRGCASGQPGLPLLSAAVPLHHFLRPPGALLFGDGGVIRGVLEKIWARGLMTIGGVLGCEGQVGLGYWGGNGARMLAQAAASGIAAAGGTPLAHDLECAAQAAWLAEHHQIPVSLFLEQEGDRIYLHLFGRSGLPLGGPGAGLTTP